MKRVTLAIAMAVAACGSRSELFDETPTNPTASVVTPDAAGPLGPVVDASVPDAGALGNDGAGSGAIDASGVPEVAKCLGAANVIAVVGTVDYGAYPHLNGAFEATGAEGTWTDLGNSTIVQVDSPDGRWAFVAMPDVIHGQYLWPGTFDSGFPGSYAQVKANGVGCNGFPTGTFTIVDLAMDQGSGRVLSRLLAWFDLACGDGGRLDGCVRYTR